MLTIEMIQLMFSAISQSFMFAQAFAFNQEIVDDGTKNRIWSFILTMGLMYVAFLPLAQLFPTIDLSIYQYPAIALTGVIHNAPICSIVIKQNQSTA